MVNLVTVPGIELMRTGKWNLSTGEWECTTAEISAAIDAHGKGLLRKPVIRLGHNDPRFTGDPAVGWLDNLRASADGQALIGDMVGVPEWLAEILPSAYPSRSIEGLYDYTAPDGGTHDFVLTGLALLGATRPGVENLQSLQDVARLYDIAAAGQVGGKAIEFTIEAAGDPKPYGNVAYADEKNGKYPIDTAEHVRAAWSYINMPKNQKEFSAGELASIKAKIEAAAKKFGITISAASAAETEGDAIVALPEYVAEALGIDASADEDTIKAALDKRNAVEAEAVAEVVEPVVEAKPELVAASAGLMQIEASVYQQLKADAEAGRAAREQQIADADLGIVMAAIKDGKIAPARRDHWLNSLKADREGTQTVLASLAAGLIPTSEMGHGVGSEAPVDAEAAIKNRVEDRIFASLGIAKKGTN
jgi:Mu-like prophage I protein